MEDYYFDVVVDPDFGAIAALRVGGPHGEIIAITAQATALD